MESDMATQPTKAFAAGDAAPLKVCPLTISATVEETTTNPCSINTVCINDIQTNMPVRRTDFCSPTITLSGLKNAIAATGNLPLTQLSSDLDSSNANEANEGTWSCGKTLTMQLTPGTILRHTEQHKFCFDVTNPAMPQAAVPISITVNGCGNRRSGNSCSAVSHQMGSILAITTATIQTRVRQSSSFPCDPANTITVEFKSNVNMLSSCQWKVCWYSENASVRTSLFMYVQGLFSNTAYLG